MRTETDENHYKYCVALSYQNWMYRQNIRASDYTSKVS